MRLEVIGAGPAYTNRRGAAGASFLVTLESEMLLLDLGHGAFANLASTVEPARLGAVLISHLHPDHFIDLVPLRHYLRYQLNPPGRVAVFGPAGLAGRLDGVNGEPGFAAGSLDVHEFAALPSTIGSFGVAIAPVTHSPGSCAIRVWAAGDAGPSDGRPGDAGLVYSGDCGRAEDLLPLVRPGDTLLSECAFGKGPVPPGAQHLTSTDAARVAEAAGASRLLLTHLQMGYDRTETLAAAEAVFHGPIQLVTEGDVFDI